MEEEERQKGPAKEYNKTCFLIQVQIHDDAVKH